MVTDSLQQAAMSSKREILWLLSYVGVAVVPVVLIAVCAPHNMYQWEPRLSSVAWFLIVLIITGLAAAVYVGQRFWFARRQPWAAAAIAAFWLTVAPTLSHGLLDRYNKTHGHREVLTGGIGNLVQTYGGRSTSILTTGVEFILMSESMPGYFRIRSTTGGGYYQFLSGDTARVELRVSVFGWSISDVKLINDADLGTSVTSAL